MPESLGATVHRLPRDEEFEPFVTEMHRVIQAAGPGAVFVFDCLSNLVESLAYATGCSATSSCSPAPASTISQSLAYFPLIRHRHSFHASTPIAETTQILIDVYRHKGQLYLHPTKVEHRFSSTMNMLHRWDGDLFQPVMESSTIAEILTSRPWFGLESVRLRPGKWTRHLLSGGGDLGGHPARRTARRRPPTGMLRELLRMIDLATIRVLPGWWNAISRCPTCWKSGNA